MACVKVVTRIGPDASAKITYAEISWIDVRERAWPAPAAEPDAAGCVAEAFTPTGAEVEWARSCTDDEHHLLALVVWLKSYQPVGGTSRSWLRSRRRWRGMSVRCWGWPTMRWRCGRRLRRRPSGTVRWCASGWGWPMKRPGFGRWPRRRSVRRCSPRTTRPEVLGEASVEGLAVSGLRSASVLLGGGLETCGG